MSNQTTQEILGSISQFIPKKEKTKTLTTFSEFPKADLLTNNFNFDNVVVCNSFTNDNFKILIKNTNLDRQKLFKCVVDRGLSEYVKIILNDKRKNHQINPAINNNDAIIRASTLGYVGVVKELLKDSRVDPSAINNKAIRLASMNGQHEVIKELLKDSRVNPSVNGNNPINEASARGYYKVVELLLKVGPNDQFPNRKKVNPFTFEGKAFLEASRKGHIEVVKILYDEIIKTEQINRVWLFDKALDLAYEEGRTEIVKFLLKNESLDPSSNDNYAIKTAVKNGHTELVKELLKDDRIDPTVDSNDSIKIAFRRNFFEVVKVLAQHPSIKTPKKPKLKILGIIIETLAD